MLCKMIWNIEMWAAASSWNGTKTSHKKMYEMEEREKNTRIRKLAHKMNKILENEWFWVRYPINGLVLDLRRKKYQCHIRMWFALWKWDCVCVTFGLHFLSFFALGVADVATHHSISFVISSFFCSPIPSIYSNLIVLIFLFAKEYDPHT